MDNVEKWVLDDGRRAEKRVTEVCNADGKGERIVELHVEDARPLKLQQRVVEKTKPIVFERTIETIDPATGEVIEQKLESIDPKVQMQLVEHIGVRGPEAMVSAQSVVDDCDCHVTKEEMIDTIVAAIKATKEQEPVVDFSNKLNSLGLVDEVEKRVADVSGLDNTQKLQLLGIVAGLILLGYVVFFM